MTVEVKDLHDYPFDLLDKSDEPIVIDTETIGITDDESEEPDTAIDQSNAQVIYYSWAAVDVPYGAGPTLTPRGMEFFQKLCACKRPKICHNKKADYIFCRNTGIEIVNLKHDTIIAHCLLDEYSIHKLKYLSPVLLHHDRSDEKVLHELWSKYPKLICNYKVLTEGYQEKLDLYSCRDARDTLELYQRFEPQLRNQGLWDLYLELCEAENAYIDVEIRGVRIDLPKVEETLTLLAPGIEEMRSLLFSSFGEEFNPASPQQLVKVLLKWFPLHERNEPSASEVRKAREEKRQPVGTYKTGKETLYQWLHDEKIQYLFAFRFLSKAASSLRNYARQIDKNGRAHPSIKQTTRTGRTSISGIPLQQIPKQKGRLSELDVGNKELADKCSNAYRMVRASFIPAEGAYFLSDDYKQIEYYCAAHYTGSERLIRLLNTGIDFHEMTCKIVFGDYNEDIRTLIKIINYGILYGMGIPLLASRIRPYTKEAATSVIARYEHELPEMRALQASVTQQARRQGYVKDVFGRRYHFLRDEPHKMVCYLCQGTAANIKKRALVRLSALYKNRHSGVIMDIHDDLVQEVFPDDVSLLPQVKQEMERFPEFDVPIQIDMSVGKNLLDMKKVTVEEAQDIISNQKEIKKG